MVVNHLPALEAGQLLPAPAERVGALGRLTDVGVELRDQLGNGAARPVSRSYQALKICRKIHCVQR
jgi:hypothetical protein